MKYEIRIEDGLDERWTAWFDGLLAKVRDLGLPLLSVQRIEQDNPSCRR